MGFEVEDYYIVWEFFDHVNMLPGFRWDSNQEWKGGVQQVYVVSSQVRYYHEIPSEGVQQGDKSLHYKSYITDLFFDKHYLAFQQKGRKKLN